MNKDDDPIMDFVDALSLGLAEQVLEDENALGKELNDMGSGRLEAMSRRLKAAGKRIVAQERRRRLQESTADEGQETRASGRYDDLTREELLALVLARTAGGERRAVAHHRELDSMPTEDLRSLLEDMNAIEGEENA